MTGTGPSSHILEVASPPCDASGITQLPKVSWDDMLRDLNEKAIKRLCVVVDESSFADPERTE